MEYQGFLMNYFSWHYTQAVSSGLRIGRDLIRFLFRFFAVPLHFRTLFSRFERIGEGYSRGFVLAEILTSALVNTIMRLVGAAARLGVILIGLLTTAAAGLFALLALVVWLLLPAAVAVLWSFGLLLILGI